MSKRHDPRSPQRLLLGLAVALALGFTIGMATGLGGQRDAPTHPAYAAPPENRGQGHGHAYGQKVADLVHDAQGKGRDKKELLAELKRQGLAAQDKADRKAIQERDKRMKDQRDARREAIGADVMRKVGQDLLGRPKIKDAPAAAKGALRKAHGLEPDAEKGWK